MEVFWNGASKSSNMLLNVSGVPHAPRPISRSFSKVELCTICRFISAWSCGKKRKTLDTSHIYPYMLWFSCWPCTILDLCKLITSPTRIVWSYFPTILWFHAALRSCRICPSHVPTLRSWVLFWNLIHHDDQNSKPDSKPDSKPSHVQSCWQKKQYTTLRDW